MFQDSPQFERFHQATRLAHRRLERRVDSYRTNFDLHNYRALLQDFWGYYQPLERKLSVLADHYFPSPYSQQRRKAPRLEQDLLSIGMTQADIAALPLCGRLPAIPTLPQVFGVLYVLDGAALDERIATTYLHLVADKLGIGPLQGGSFFSHLRDHYDPLLDAYWQELTAVTEAVEESDLRDSAIQSAIETLECFQTWLDHRQQSQRSDSLRTNSKRWSSQWESRSVLSA
jgi:heme oxygenase (biliverdin-IX-beta and delta-forming)